MFTFTHTADPTPFARGGVYALGNFDGVHRGHQALIKATLDYARYHEIPARVLTFEPHPRSLFAPDLPPFRLTPDSAKKRLLREMGIDNVITMTFDNAFASLSAQAFAQDLLRDEMGAVHLVAGFDFVFGHRRAGNIAVLRSLLMMDKIEITEVAPLRDGLGEIISATRLRTLLQEGDVAAANLLLGRPWAIEGVVVQGALRGRTINFPTANVALGDYVRPRFGVYAIRARRVGSEEYFPGIANIGVRPTVEKKGAELLEFHLFDVHADLYGQDWEVELHHFIRPEATFPDLQVLRAQIVTDVARAKSLLFRAG